MIRHILFASILALAALAAKAQSLTAAQFVTIRAAVCADVATARPLLQAGDVPGLKAWANASTVTFITWKSKVTIEEVGDNIVGTELSGLSTLNTTRLQAIIMLSPNGVNPSKGDRRAFFDDVFSGTGGALTRPKLLALWKRPATRAERVFATGTGTDLAPATLIWEGALSDNDVARIIFQDNGTIYTC
jgi:hypothetical protein